MKLDLSKSFDLNKATLYFEKLKEKNAKIELKEFRQSRSLSQNSYLHVCFTILSDATGYTIEEIKTITKREYGSFMVYEVKGNKFLRSTSTLNTLEMTSFIEWLRHFANDQLGAYIPTSEEYLQSEFEISKQLEHIK
jgi:hypothetical protein